MHQQRSGACLSRDIEEKRCAPASFSKRVNKHVAHGTNGTECETQKADLKWCWWTQITAARMRWKIHFWINSLTRQKVENIFPSLLFYISLINLPHAPRCHCLALMNLNTLTFSLADKYLSNPAIERVFFFPQPDSLAHICMCFVVGPCCLRDRIIFHLIANNYSATQLLCFYFM